MSKNNDNFIINEETLRSKKVREEARKKALSCKAYIMRQCDDILHDINSLEDKNRTHGYTIGTMIIFLTGLFMDTLIAETGRLGRGLQDWECTKKNVVAELEKALNYTTLSIGKKHIN